MVRSNGNEFHLALNFKYGTVRAFDIFSGKTENFREKVRYASRLETASVIKILTENGTVRYGTVRYGTVLWIKSDSLLYIGFFWKRSKKCYFDQKWTKKPILIQNIIFFPSGFGFLIEFYYIPELEMNIGVLEKNSDFFSYLDYYYFTRQETNI
jgi:hypothetical protein